jgi:hypothetical protein
MYQDDPRLRDLCEKASKELDHDKLINLVRQISVLLEKRKRKPEVNPPEKKALPVPHVCGRADRVSWPGVGAELPSQMAMAWQM